MHIHQVPQFSHKGGGVAVMCRESFKMHTKPAFKASSFEPMEVSITALSVTIKLIVVYSVSPNKKNGIKNGSFSQGFADLAERISTESGKLLTVGDFNVQWDDSNATETQVFRSLLNSYDLKLHVDECTHKKDHILV